MKNLHLAIALFVAAVAGVVTSFVLASHLGPQIFGGPQAVATSDVENAGPSEEAGVEVSVRAMKFGAEPARAAAISTVAVNDR